MAQFNWPITALCQTYHPDKFEGKKEDAIRIMKIINNSYGILIDPVKRAIHDVWIREQEAKLDEQSRYSQFSNADEKTNQKQKNNQEKGAQFSSTMPPESEGSKSKATRSYNP